MSMPMNTISCLRSPNLPLPRFSGTRSKSARIYSTRLRQEYQTTSCSSPALSNFYLPRSPGPPPRPAPPSSSPRSDTVS
eukprot:763451-Hanusia_phi.AAC.2